jgi:hypothetical protein
MIYGRRLTVKCKILAYLDAYNEPNFPHPNKTSDLQYFAEGRLLSGPFSHDLAPELPSFSTWSSELARVAGCVSLN